MVAPSEKAASSTELGPRELPMDPIASFDVLTAGRIRFGSGVAAELPSICASLGKRPLVVLGSDPSRYAVLRSELADRGLDVAHFSVVGEPTTRIAEEAVDRAREHAADLIVGLGGGSVLDTGKAVAALLTNGGSPLDYLEVIGAGRAIVKPSLPYIAVPTTSGTGAEVTKNAVLKSEEHGVKVSLRSDSMVPRVALVDPLLTLTAPPEVTASTGLDALTQVLEPYVSHAHSPFTDALCREGLVRGARSLRRAFDDGSDPVARSDMALVSLFGGLALANAKLGAVHGFAGPLGGMIAAPHGALCASLLPWAIEVNVRALRERAPRSAALRRFDEVGRLLTGREDADAEDAIAWTMETARSLAIEPLRSYGLGAERVEEAVEKAARSSSMKGNPIELSPVELREILEKAR